MPDNNVKIHGLKELEKRLIELGGNDGIAGAKIIRSAMMTATLPLFKDIKARAPFAKDPRPRRRKTKKGNIVEIRPGFLRYRLRRRSYINKTGEGNINISREALVRVRIGAFTPYAHYVEMGADDAPAQPFMRPAIDAGWRSTLERFRGLIDKRLTSYLKRQAKKSVKT